MLSRRALVLSLAALGSGLGYALLRPATARQVLDAPTAFRRAETGDVLLVDIREPGEWRRTGSPRGAHRLDMRRPDFLAALSDLAKGDPSRPIALICASGGRSARLARALTEAGFTNVLDVAEGMLGSSAGPGWLARGLPVITG